MLSEKAKVSQQLSTDRPNQRLTVIIPTWNRRDLVLDCLASLDKQRYRDFSVLVVDDGSTDDTAETVESAFPATEVLGRDRNGGFCAAANTGLRAATTELVMLLNNDVTLDEGCLDIMVRVLDTSEADMVAPLVLWRDAPEVVYSAGDRQLVNGRPEAIGFRQSRDAFELPERIFGVSAGAGLYRRCLFEDIGYLDESFGAYFEDSDLNFRARIAGYRAALAPQAVAWHIGSATLGNRTWWRDRQCFKNHAKLVTKNMPTAFLLRHFPAILRERLHQLNRVFGSGRAEFGTVRGLFYTLGAMGQCIRELPPALCKRRANMRNRRIDTAQLDQWLDRP